MTNINCTLQLRHIKNSNGSRSLITYAYVLTEQARLFNHTAFNTQLLVKSARALAEPPTRMKLYLPLRSTALCQICVDNAGVSPNPMPHTRIKKFYVAQKFDGIHAMCFNNHRRAIYSAEHPWLVIVLNADVAANKLFGMSVYDLAEMKTMLGAYLFGDNYVETA